VRLVDATPIDAVIDAFLLIPKYQRPNAQHDALHANVAFQSHRLSARDRRSSPTPDTTSTMSKRKAVERIDSFSEIQAQWQELSDEARQVYQPPTCPSKGSEHARDVRAVLHKCIEERLWDVICGRDVVKPSPTTDVRHPMTDERVLRTVKRMFHPDVNVHNGPSSFFYTRYGWLGFTPFLLAAERQKLTLVKYLHETCPESITVASRSQAGNNAYALSRAYLKEMRSTPEDLEASQMLAYLTQLGVPHRAKRDEYAAWAR